MGRMKEKPSKTALIQRALHDFAEKMAEVFDADVLAEDPNVTLESDVLDGNYLNVAFRIRIKYHE